MVPSVVVKPVVIGRAPALLASQPSRELAAALLRLRLHARNRVHIIGVEAWRRDALVKLRQGARDGTQCHHVLDTNVYT